MQWAGHVACMGDVNRGSLIRCQGHYENNRTVPSLAISSRMGIYTSISTRLCRILMG